MGHSWESSGICLGPASDQSTARREWPLSGGDFKVFTWTWPRIREPLPPRDALVFRHGDHGSVGGIDAWRSASARFLRVLDGAGGSVFSGAHLLCADRVVHQPLNRIRIAVLGRPLCELLAFFLSLLELRDRGRIGWPGDIRRDESTGLLTARTSEQPTSYSGAHQGHFRKDRPCYFPRRHHSDRRPCGTTSFPRRSLFLGARTSSPTVPLRADRPDLHFAGTSSSPCRNCV
jgi:hypothetical protein